MSPNIMNMEKEAQEREALQEDGGERGDEPKPKVRPVETALERLYRMGYTRRALLIIAVIGLIALILLICVIALAARGCCGPNSGRPLCLKPDCYRSTARLIQQVNTSVEACSDFYEFACGGWLRDNEPIAEGHGDVSVLANAYRDFMVKSREFVDTLHYPVNFEELQWKVKALYHSCMELDNIEGSGHAPLLRYINELNGWKPIKGWYVQAWNWDKVFQDLHVVYGASPFFSISFRPDDIHPLRNIIQISPAGLGLPDPSYYFLPIDDKIIQAYQKLMRDAAYYLGATNIDSAEFAKDTFHFEKRIAEKLLFAEKYATEDEQKEIAEEPKQITLSELRKMSTSINWVDFLKAYFPNTDISENTQIYLSSRHFITELSTLISTTDKGSLNCYLIWTLVFKYIPYLSKPYQNTVEAYRLVYSGALTPQPRWDFCIETVNRIFDVAMTSFYVEKHIPKETLLNADEVYNNVKNAFADTVKGSSWMENSEAQSTAYKINEISSKLTYENYVWSSESLNNYYGHLKIARHDLTKNIVNGATFRRTQIEDAITNSPRYSRNTIINKESSPYYSEFNRLVPLPALLHEPYIHSYYPKYMVYGALGSELGQELVQSIQDSDDRIYRDLLGNCTWNNISLPWSYVQCLASNFSLYSVDDDYKVNGNKSLTSILADVEGLNQAYKAMIDWEARNGLEPTLPDITYTAEQLFFISYAQTMCSSMRKPYLDNYFQLSSTLPNKIRVLGTLTQLPQFASAFSCDSNTDHLCKLW